MLAIVSFLRGGFPAWMTVVSEMAKIEKRCNAFCLISALDSAKMIKG